MSDALEIEKYEYQRSWDLYQARFEYAWRYFAFHARQRTTMFNFFTVFSGFVIAACVSLFTANEIGMLLAVSLLGSFITTIFIYLERRNEELVNLAEEILKTLEREVLFKDLSRYMEWPKQRSYVGKMEAEIRLVPLGIFTREDHDKLLDRTSKYSHGTWMPRVQLSVVVCYLLFAAYSLYRLYT